MSETEQNEAPPADASAADPSSTDSPTPERSEAPVGSDNPAPTPAAMAIHKSGVTPTEGPNMYLWGSVILVGALLGFFWFQKRIAAEHAALKSTPDEVTALGAQPGTDLPTGTNAPTLRTRSDAGFAVRVPPGLVSEWKNAGVNRILRITKGKSPVLSINSGPIYPWVTIEDLAKQVEAWKTGPIDAYGLSVNFSGKAWGVQKGKPGLVLVDSGRVIRILTKDWKAPEVQQILSTYRTKPGGDWRSVYMRTFKIDAKTAEGNPDEKLLAEVERYLTYLGDDLEKYTPAIIFKGVQAYRAKGFDCLDTRILRDLLASPVRELQRDRRQAAKKTPDRYKKHKKTGVAPTSRPQSPH